MKTRYLVSYILLTILVILLLSTVVQASEYSKVDTEVKAEEILKHIENSDDIVLYNCSIIGELNISSIKLKTVPNPLFDELLEEGHTKEEIIALFGLNDKLNVIESNIKIIDSTFIDNVDFSSVQFNSSVKFLSTNFTGDAYFYYANFTGDADFSYADFTGYASFHGTNFTGDADFSVAYFTGYAVFSSANFNGDADFSSANFTDGADFSYANFTGYANFHGTNFAGDTYFQGTSFTGYVYFYYANFNDDADFEGLEGSENIITDGKNCKVFMESYNNEARYTDTDNVYYNYRKYAQYGKDLTDLSKWTDVLSWITCGYGTKLSYPLSWTAIFVMLFAIIYKNPRISCKNKNKKTFMRLCWGKPGIYRKGKEGEESVSFLECLYFSINIFTRLGSVGLEQKDGFRKWVSLEGFLGWIIFALVSVTLMRMFIRS